MPSQRYCMCHFYRAGEESASEVRGADETLGKHVQGCCHRNRHGSLVEWLTRGTNVFSSGGI